MADPEQPTIEALFNHLDRWRHFAGYPLETRVDALFGLFLPKVIEDRFGVDGIHPQVIPQFPLKKTHNNRSDKVDFFALSKDGGRAFLIEVKTDMESLEEEQYGYLIRAKERGMACILSELRKIAQATRSRRKYLHLINALAKIKLMELSGELEEEMNKEGANVSPKLMSGIEVCHSTDSQIEVVFVQPIEATSDKDTGFCHIYFDEIASSIQSYGDLGCLFAGYLMRWKTDPGRCPPGKA